MDQASVTTPLESPPVPVEIATAASADVPIYLSGLGTVQAFNTVTIRTRVDGQLQKVLFTEGQTVKKGDLLAVVDPRPFQAALDEANAKIAQDQANLKNAQLILDRDTQLTAKQFTAVETTDTQRATVEQLQGLLAQDQAAQSDAATQLSYTQLTSPIDGRTGFRLVDEGNIVHATDTTGIVVITQLEPISAISTLPEDDLLAVRAALQAGSVPVTAFTTDGATNLGDGTLSLIDNEIDQSAGTIRLKSTFPNRDHLLWPGQSIEIRLLQQVTRDTTTVPSAALQRGSDGFFVYVAGADNVVKARPVKPGQIAGGLAVVKEGLAPGERVVTAGQYRLDNGVRISPQGGGSASVGTSAGG
jgi:multidrug efflux system membrane fusion protein